MDNVNDSSTAKEHNLCLVMHLNDGCVVKVGCDDNNANEEKPTFSPQSHLNNLIAVNPGLMSKMTSHLSRGRGIASPGMVDTPLSSKLNILAAESARLDAQQQAVKQLIATQKVTSLNSVSVKSG